MASRRKDRSHQAVPHHGHEKDALTTSAGHYTKVHIYVA